MAREIKLLYVLWLAAACLASLAKTEGVTSTTKPPTSPAPTTTGGPTTKLPTSPAPTTTGGPTTKPPTSPAPTTTGGPTTKPPTSPAPTTTGGPTTKPPTSPAPTTTGGPTTKPPTSPAPTTTGGPTTKPPTSPAPTTTGGPTTKPPASPAPTTTGGPNTKPPTPPAPTTTGGPSTKPPTPPVPPTTAGPGGPTTKPPTPPVPSTTAGPGGPTTKPPTPPVPPTTPKLPEPCQPDTCGDGSTCVPRANQKFECLCLPGDIYIYDSKRCESAKVFPGQLTLPQIVYSANLENPASSEFLEASTAIVAKLNGVYIDVDGYSESTVQKLWSNNTSRVWSRATIVVVADVDIIFKAEADIDTKTVTETLEKAISECGGCLLEGSTFKDEDLCERNACDNVTTQCKAAAGSFSCKCKEGYITTDFTTRLCTACPSGKKAVSNECVDCPFGYSGLNCNESWQLTLVIVGSVLGALFLIAVLLLPVMALRPWKKSSKKNKDVDIGRPAMSFAAKAPLVNGFAANSRPVSVNGSANAFASGGVPRIPRATTNSSLDRRDNLEMTLSNSRQNLISAGRTRLYDDPDEIRPYTQSRPQTNPYTQSRPQSNPYSSNQGFNNPYYKQDNGRY